jgi:hypothetical protein
MAKKKVVAEAGEKTGRTTKITFCGCINEMQDEIYGDHKRVHNKGLKSWNCTGCGTKKNI